MNPLKTTISKGFTLVELMVATAITAILMVGISTFFSGTFSQLLQVRERTESGQGHFVVNSILQKKLLSAEAIHKLGPGGSYVVIQNETSNGDMPFTYIGESDEKIAFKDFFVFNGREGEITSADTSIKNPGGITLLNGKYYVTAPQENALYICQPIANCSLLDLPEALSQPMDVTSNGTDTLYLTDAGSDRVLLIYNPDTNPTMTALSNEFNFPTGIAFYSGQGTDYLFVADTYNHLIKKITPAIGVTETVLGQQGSPDCDNTAEYCQLNFPTGLAVWDDGAGEALYIADSGSGRVLKVFDPNPDLTNYQMTVDLGESKRISRIEFSFPSTATVNPVQEGEGGNTLHKGKYSVKELSLNYSLAARTKANEMEEECTDDDEPVCVSYFRGFYTDDENQIFEVGDDIELAGESYQVTEITEQGNNVWKVSLAPKNSLQPPVPSDVRITSEFSGEYDFFLNLSDIVFQPGFNQIQIQVYDENNKVIQDLKKTVTIRTGDGQPGTFEDQISVHSSGHPYVTGLSGTAGGLIVEEQANYSVDFESFDYQSDFDVSGLKLSPKNNEKILDLEFTAALAEEGEGVNQTYHLSANLNP